MIIIRNEINNPPSRYAGAYILPAISRNATKRREPEHNFCAPLPVAPDETLFEALSRLFISGCDLSGMIDRRLLKVTAIRCKRFPGRPPLRLLRSRVPGLSPPATARPYLECGLLSSRARIFVHSSADRACVSAAVGLRNRRRRDACCPARLFEFFSTRARTGLLSARESDRPSQ